MRMQVFLNGDRLAEISSDWELEDIVAELGSVEIKEDGEYLDIITKE